MRTWSAVLLLLLALAGCATYYAAQLDQLYGVPDPARYDRPAPAAAAAADYTHVKSILDNRCAVCHGCNDAPCQLNLASHAGLTRGANREQVYATRLLATQPTRLFFDAQSNAAWRAKDFHPVLNERAATPEAERESGVLYRMLRLKQRTPGPAGGVLPKERFDFSLDRAQQCPAIEGMDAYERKHPEWGMPFGLPALLQAEHDALARWIEAGAPAAAAAPLPPRTSSALRAGKLSSTPTASRRNSPSRYIFEHWFIAHLYFDDLPGSEYFELVRSRTPPGTADRGHRHSPAVRRPGRAARVLPAAARVGDAARQDAHALCAERCAPRAPQGMVHRCALRSQRPALARACGGLQSVRRVPRASGRGALPADARGGAVHPDGLHQGPGVPRPGGGRRHQRPLLGDVRAARRGKGGVERGVLRARARQPAPARRGGKQRRPAEMAPLRRARGRVPQGEERSAQAGAGRRRHARHPVGR